MSLSDAAIQDILAQHFVCSWSNIKGKVPYAGSSGTYACDQAAVHTTNGAGGKNVQILLLSPHGEVLSCLPGFWNPRDLLLELQFAQQVEAIRNLPLPDGERNDRFLLAHLEFASELRDASLNDSELQPFDQQQERTRGTDSPFARPVEPGKKAPTGAKAMKSVAQVLHEQMAALPFVKLADFDIGKFVDYGTRHYDKMLPYERRGPTKPPATPPVPPQRVGP